MKISNLVMLTAIAAAAFTSSCKKDNTLAQAGGDRVVAQFSSTIAGQLQTKVAGNTWDSNDAIGVFMAKGAGLADAIDQNKKYTTLSGNGNFAASATDQSIFFPTDGTAVNFTAYYPYQETVTANKIQVNVASQTQLAAIDLLYSNNAKNLTKNNPVAALTFEHQLAKLEFTVKNGEGLTNLNGLTTVIAGANTTAEFDLTTGLLSNAARPANITAKTSQSALESLSEAIILPTNDANGVTVTFTVGAKDYKWSIPSGTKYEKGKKYVYGIELKADGTSPVGTAAVLTATITNWTNIPGGDFTLNPDGTPTSPTDPTNPTDPQGQVSLYKESFGPVQKASDKYPINTYDGYDVKTVVYSDAENVADIRSTNTISNHIWLPSKKDCVVKISGINTANASALTLKFQMTANVTGAKSTAIALKYNGQIYVLPSVDFTQNQFKAIEIDLGAASANATGTIEFISGALANTAGYRIDDIELVGKK